MITKAIVAKVRQQGRLILQAALKRYHLSFKDLTVKEISTADALAVFTDPDTIARFTAELVAEHLAARGPGLSLGRPAGRS